MTTCRHRERSNAEARREERGNERTVPMGGSERSARRRGRWARQSSVLFEDTGDLRELVEGVAAAEGVCLAGSREGGDGFEVAFGV